MCIFSNGWFNHYRDDDVKGQNGELAICYYQILARFPQQYHMLHLWLRNDVRDTSRPETKARILTTKKWENHGKSSLPVPTKTCFFCVLKAIWTPKAYLKHQTSGDMTGSLGFLPFFFFKPPGKSQDAFRREAADGTFDLVTPTAPRVSNEAKESRCLEDHPSY